MKEDLRVLKTRRAIEDTFLALLREMPFERITVKLIVERAMVNKGTFYRHYLDKYDLAEKAAARLLNELTSSMQERFKRAAHTEAADAMIAGALDASMQQLQLLEALSDVQVDGVPIRLATRRAIMDVAGRALQSLGQQGSETETWAVASLVLSYQEYARTSENPAGILEYLHALHKSIGAYISYLEVKPDRTR